MPLLERWVSKWCTVWVGRHLAKRAVPPWDADRDEDVDSSYMPSGWEGDPRVYELVRSHLLTASAMRGVLLPVDTSVALAYAFARWLSNLQRDDPSAVCEQNQVSPQLAKLAQELGLVHQTVPVHEAGRGDQGRASDAQRPAQGAREGGSHDAKGHRRALRDLWHPLRLFWGCTPGRCGSPGASGESGGH